MNEILARYLKIILAVGIFICMFLPLSKCSHDLSGPRKHSETTKSNEAIEESIKENEAIKISKPIAKVNARAETDGVVIRMTSRVPENLDDYIFTLGFILPLLFCIPYSKNGKLHLAQLLVQMLFSGWLIFEVYILVYSFFTPLYGGYLLTLFSLAFFCNGFFELFAFIRSARRAST